MSVTARGGAEAWTAKARHLPSIQGPYKPKTATADLTMIPPSGLLRICGRPVAARKICSNCSAGGTYHMVFMRSLDALLVARSGQSIRYAGTRFCAPFRLSRLIERDPRSRGSAFRSFLAEWQISDLLAANRSFTPCKSVRLER